MRTVKCWYVIGYNQKKYVMDQTSNRIFDNKGLNYDINFDLDINTNASMSFMV